MKSGLSPCPSWCLAFLLATTGQLWGQTAEELTTTNADTIQPFLREFDPGESGNAMVVSFGDSMADAWRSIAYVAMCNMSRQVGLAGTADNFQNSFMYKTSGEVIVHDGAADRGWVWWQHFEVQPEGSLWWETQNPPQGNLGDRWGVAYIKQPTGGDFVLMISTNGGPWGPALELSGYSPTNVGTYVELELPLDHYRLRVDGVSGSNVIVFPRYRNTTIHGIETSFLMQGGIPVSYVTDVPPEIREPILESLNPKLLIWHMKESEGQETEDGMETCENWWSNSVPQMGVVYIGTPYVQADPEFDYTLPQNRMVRSIALAHHRAYVDLMNPSISYDWMAARGFMADQTHLNYYGSTYLEAFLSRDLGLYAIGAPKTLSIAPDESGSMNLSFETKLHVDYVLQSSSNSCDWNDEGMFHGNNLVVSTNVSAEADMMLFRLDLRRP
jgi:hypothetical protein